MPRELSLILIKGQPNGVFVLTPRNLEPSSGTPVRKAMLGTDSALTRGGGAP
jgi:hypothetical protein